MAAKNDNSEAKDQVSPSPASSEAFVKQANLSTAKLRKFIKVPKQLAGAYLSARFDDEGRSDAPVDPAVIEALQAQFPGISIEELPSPTGEL